jgi:hypothetical protein
MDVRCAPSLYPRSSAMGLVSAGLLPVFVRVVGRSSASPRRDEGEAVGRGATEGNGYSTGRCRQEGECACTLRLRRLAAPSTGSQRKGCPLVRCFFVPWTPATCRQSKPSETFRARGRSVACVRAAGPPLHLTVSLCTASLTRIGVYVCVSRLPFAGPRLLSSLSSALCAALPPQQQSAGSSHGTPTSAATGGHLG